jgi:type I restriction enzyme, R subunit
MLAGMRRRALPDRRRTEAFDRADRKAYQNAIENSDTQNARIEHDKALGRVMTTLLADHTELFKQYSDNPSFNKWLADTVFRVTFRRDKAAG